MHVSVIVLVIKYLCVCLICEKFGNKREVLLFEPVSDLLAFPWVGIPHVSVAAFGLPPDRGIEAWVCHAFV